MKKSDAKVSIFGRGIAAKSSSAASSKSSSGIFVFLYNDQNCYDSEHTLTVQEFGKTFSVEELCYMAVEKLKMTPLVAPLFALAHQGSVESCLPPNEKILCSDDCAHKFVLRVRFVPPESVISKLPHIDHEMFNYLFQQIRSDFINDYIVYRDKTIGQEYLLGLAVIDMVRYGKQHCISLADLRNVEPQTFIPASAKNKFSNIFDKVRLQINFKPHLEEEYKKYEKDTVVNTQLTYIKSVSEYAEHYGMETFRIVNDFSSSSETAFVQVKPYDSKFPGLNIYRGKVCIALLTCCRAYH